MNFMDGCRALLTLTCEPIADIQLQPVAFAGRQRGGQLRSEKCLFTALATPLPAGFVVFHRPLKTLLLTYDGLLGLARTTAAAADGDCSSARAARSGPTFVA